MEIVCVLNDFQDGETGLFWSNVYRLLLNANSWVESMQVVSLCRRCIVFRCLICRVLNLFGRVCLTHVGVLCDTLIKG